MSSLVIIWWVKLNMVPWVFAFWSCFCSSTGYGLPFSIARMIDLQLASLDSRPRCG